MKKRRKEAASTIKGSLNKLPNSDYHLKRMLNIAMTALGIAGNPRAIGRQEMLQIADHMGITITQLQATEIVLKARGPQMEDSNY